MKFAVIQTGGKQYQVSEGDVITVEKLSKGEKTYSAGDTVTFDEVLLVDDGSSINVGSPSVKASVTGEYIEDTTGPKMRIQKFKAKSNYDKVIGHRQKLSKVKITSIA